MHHFSEVCYGNENRVTRQRFSSWVRDTEAKEDGAILVLAAFLMILIFAAAALALALTTEGS